MIIGQWQLLSTPMSQVPFLARLYIGLGGAVDWHLVRWLQDRISGRIATLRIEYAITRGMREILHQPNYSVSFFSRVRFFCIKRISPLPAVTRENSRRNKRRKIRNNLETKLENQ